MDPKLVPEMTDDDIKKQRVRFDLLAKASKKIDVVCLLCSTYKDQSEEAFCKIYDQQVHYLAMEPHPIDVSSVLPQCFIELRHKNSVLTAPAQSFWGTLATDLLEQKGCKDVHAFQAGCIAEKMLALQAGTVKEPFAECMKTWFSPSLMQSVRFDAYVRMQLQAIRTYMAVHEGLHDPAAWTTGPLALEKAEGVLRSDAATHPISAAMLMFPRGQKFVEEAQKAVDASKQSMKRATGLKQD